MSRAQRRRSDALHIKDVTADNLEDTERRRRPSAQARGETTPELAVRSSLPFSKAGVVAPMRLRNDGTLGEGRKTCSLIVTEPPPIPASAHARARTTLTRTRARRACGLGLCACFGREAVAELEAFCGVSLTSFWNDGALGKLGDGERRQAAFERKKPKNPKYTLHCPASSHEATTKSKSTKALTPEGKAWGPQQPLLPLPVASPQAPQHQGEGRGSSLKGLTRSLDVCMVE